MQLNTVLAHSTSLRWKFARTNRWHVEKCVCVCWTGEFLRYMVFRLSMDRSGYGCTLCGRGTAERLPERRYDLIVVASCHTICPGNTDFLSTVCRITHPPLPGWRVSSFGCGISTIPRLVIGPRLRFGSSGSKLHELQSALETLPGEVTGDTPCLARRRRLDSHVRVAAWNRTHPLVFTSAGDSCSDPSGQAALSRD